MAFPDVRPKPGFGDGQSAGAAGRRPHRRAGAAAHPLPAVRPRIALAAWSTLALTIHADGRATYEVVGASPFPRHWIYDHEGTLVAKTAGSTSTAGSARPSCSAPWGDEDSPALVVAAETASSSLSVAIIDGALFRRLQAGETLVEQGDTGTEVYLLFDGVLRSRSTARRSPASARGPWSARWPCSRGTAHGHPAGGHPLPDRRGRAGRPARPPRRPRRGGTGPPRAGRLTVAAAAAPRRATLRVAVWAFHLILPLLGLWLLLAEPTFDVILEHHGIHFGLVVAVAAVNVASASA